MRKFLVFLFSVYGFKYGDFPCYCVFLRVHRVTLVICFTRFKSVNAGLPMRAWNLGYSGEREIGVLVLTKGCTVDVTLDSLC